MLKLVFYTKDARLKVRPAFPHDDFSQSCRWKDKLEYIVIENNNFMMIWSSLLPDLEPEFAEALLSLVSARYPISLEYNQLRLECPEITFKNETDEWVFFGGSFNPWHRGHQSCLSLLPDDKVCFIVPDRNPQKELMDLRPVTTILEISSKAKLRKNQFLVPTFLLENKKNPTVNWVEKLKNDFPTQKISLLMGFDSFSKLKTWLRPEDLIPRIHTMYVVSRLEEDKERNLAVDEAHAYGPELSVVFLGRHEFENLSSTNLRSQK